MALAAFSLTFAACEPTEEPVVDDGTEEVPGGDDTTPDDPAEVTFAISVSDITATGATVSVVPSDATVTYYFAAIEKSTFDSYSDAQTFATEYIADVKSYVELLGYELSDMLSQGNDSYSYAGTFTASTEYYAFAVGVDTDGTVTTDVATEAFTTGEAVASDNTFTVTENLGYITITPTNNDPYVWTISEAEGLDSFTEEELISAVISDLGADITSYMATGTDSYDYSSVLTNGVEYAVIVFGYDGGPTTGLTLYRFTYKGESGGGSSMGDTNLTGDVDFTTADVCTAEYYGDYYGSGTGNWYVTLKNSTTKDCIATEYFTELSAGTDPTGSFTITTETTTDAGTAIRGYMDYEGYMYGSCYLADGGYTYATLVEGTFTITKNADETYTVVVDTKDSAGNKVTCNYKGAVDVSDYSDYASLPSTKSIVPFKDRKSMIVSSMKQQRKINTVKALDLREKVLLR